MPLSGETQRFSWNAGTFQVEIFISHLSVPCQTASQTWIWSGRKDILRSRVARPTIQVRLPPLNACAVFPIQCDPVELVCKDESHGLNGPQEEFSFADLRPQNEPRSFFHLTNGDPPLYNPSGRFKAGRSLVGRAAETPHGASTGFRMFFGKRRP